MALVDVNSFVCTPSSLLASTPCLKCLSEHEMLAVIVGILAIGVGKTNAEAMSDSACFTCMSRKQMLQAIVTILGNQLLGDEHTPQEVVDTYHCLVCATDTQLLAAILQMLCSDVSISLTQR